LTKAINTVRAEFNSSAFELSNEGDNPRLMP
jgi:hypothetical protein